MTERFIAYYRVSTEKQGRSGLGLEAQQKAVRDYLNGGDWELVSEIVEVESGRRGDRPKLHEALALCRLYKATLIIAKMDRLSRDAHFLLGLQKSGVKFRAADLPEANEMVVGLLAVVAQAESKMISDRTKAAMAAAKARGVRFGSPQNLTHKDEGRAKGRAVRSQKAQARAQDLSPILVDLQAQGLSVNAMARSLNERGLSTSRGGKWTATQVSRVLRSGC